MKSKFTPPVKKNTKSMKDTTTSLQARIATSTLALSRFYYPTPLLASMSTNYLSTEGTAPAVMPTRFASGPKGTTTSLCVSASCSSCL